MPIRWATAATASPWRIPLLQPLLQRKLKFCWERGAASIAISVCHISLNGNLCSWLTFDSQQAQGLSGSLFIPPAYPLANLPTCPPAHLPTCSFARLTVWVVNALFTLECLMKESLHSFIRWFVHSFALFPDSFMRTRVLCSFYPAPN